MYCLKCGMKNDLHAEVCQNCGEVLSKEEFMNIDNNIQVKQENEEHPIENEISKEIQNEVNNQQQTEEVSELAKTIEHLKQFFLGSSNTSERYDGDGYCLTYDKNWIMVVLGGETDAFENKQRTSILVPIGSSALSDEIRDFNSDDEKMKLYEKFYAYWNSDIERFNIYGGSDGFFKLTDSIYYATYDYGVKEDRIVGKYVLLVAPEKNAIVSFFTNTKENLEENTIMTLELLKSIEIYEKPVTKNVVEDDELYNWLERMKNWNRYSGLRSGELGKSKSINGGWRILEDSETYFKFQDGQFWWYKSVNDLNDNYWYGTTQIITGKEGIALVGSDVSAVDQMVLNSNGNITEDDVYTIIFTPLKIISEGVDKSSTNIPEGASWTMVWVVVDHGDEGIEAQAVDILASDIAYFVKLED